MIRCVNSDPVPICGICDARNVLRGDCEHEISVENSRGMMASQRDD
jgi:hypothetical protein